jgi:hypothetical protein
MRLVLASLAALAAACVYNPDSYPKTPRGPQQTSNGGIILPGRRDKIPDTPYEVRKAEIERDRQIAGETGPTYPPLFKNQKDNGEKGGS